MTLDDFRGLALELPETVESAHMDHPDFRVGGKIFASLQPSKLRGVVKLTPEQQAQFMHRQPDVFEPAAGAWGRRGYTQVVLERATVPELREAMLAAWFVTAPPKLARQFRP